MPCVFGEDACLYPEGWIGAAIEVLREQRLALSVGEKIGEQPVKMLDRHRVVVVPPDGRAGVGVADDEFVLRTAAGVDAGIGDKRPMRGDVRLMALQGMFIKLGRAQIRTNDSQIEEPEAIGAAKRVV